MKQRTFIVVAVVVIVAVLALWLFNTTSLSGFHLVSSTPSDGGKVGYLDSIILTYSEDLSSSDTSRLTISPNVPGQVSVSQKTLRFDPKGAFATGQPYTLTVREPVSASGAITTTTTLKFTAQYVNQTDLTPSQQNKINSTTDGIQANNPLLKYIPYSTLHYQWTYTITGDTTVVYNLALNAIDIGVTHDQYQALLKQYKDEAFAYIRSKGFDPTKLTITYTPAEAASL